MRTCLKGLVKMIRTIWTGYIKVVFGSSVGAVLLLYTYYMRTENLSFGAQSSGCFSHMTLLRMGLLIFRAWVLAVTVHFASSHEGMYCPTIILVAKYSSLYFSAGFTFQKIFLHHDDKKDAFLARRSRLLSIYAEVSCKPVWHNNFYCR